MREMRTAAGFALLLTALAATAQAFQTVAARAGGAPGSVVARDESATAATLTYSWRNPNPVKDRSPDPAPLTVSTDIPVDKMRTAIDSFGVPASLFKISYTGAADLKKKQQQLQDAMAASGLIFDASTNVVNAAYDWMVAKSRNEVRGTATAIQELGLKKDLTGVRDVLGVFASFVQNLEFRVPDTYRTNAKGERVLTAGLTMPLETLYNGWGDCDTKSVLFASLLANVPNTSVVFLISTKHLFVGVQATPRMNDRFIEIRGIPYVLAEMTTPWAIGRIPDHNWNAIDQKLYRIVEIYDNTR